MFRLVHPKSDIDGLVEPSPFRHETREEGNFFVEPIVIVNEYSKK